MKYLSRLSLAIACLVLLLPGPLAAQGWSPFHTELNAVGGTTTGATAGWLTNSATAVMFHVTSASTSSATVTFQQSLDGVRWYTTATISNPTVAGEIWVCPATYKVRFNPTAHASGTLTGLISQRNMAADPIVGGCKKLDAPANAFGALAVTNLTDSGLTAGRVPYASTGGLLVDDGSLLFSGSGGTLTTPNLTDSGLTITRVPYASTAGLLIDNAAFTFTTTGGILDTTSLRSSALTTTRVPFASTAGLLIDKSTFTFVTGTDTLNAGSFTTANNGKVSSPHFLSIDGAGGAPTVAGTTSNACGTTAPAIAGKDQAATITVGGTSGTSCTVTFGTAWSVNIPACVASQNGTSTIASVVPSLTTVVIAGTFTAGDKIGLICLGY